MKILNFGINFVNTISNKTCSFGAKVHNDKLERSPENDKFVRTSANSINLSKKKLSLADMEIAASNLKDIKDEKLLNDELLYFLEPKIDAKGKATFTPSQALVIDAAHRKIEYFKKLSKELHSTAKKYGDDCADQMRDVFGGNKGLGQYIVYRVKDSESIYNKLIKEYKDNKVNGEMLDILSQKFCRMHVDDLDKDDKEILKIAVKQGEIKFEPKDYRKVADILKSTKKDYVESVNYIKDLVGTRLVLPEGSEKELKLVEKYITKAIQNGDLQITRVSNYHANHILPYIQHDTAKYWKQLVPGLKVVETSEVRKKNGYTTTQMNIVHNIPTKNGVKEILGEFQIRTQELNYIGNVEHIIYDILQNKNISKNIPELKEYYDKIGIEKAVKEVFNDKKKEQAYFNYEKAMYYWVRNNETQTDANRRYRKPRLYEYGLDDYWNLLSFDSLQRISKRASEIQKKYEKTNKLEKK